MSIRRLLLIVILGSLLIGSELAAEITYQNMIEDFEEDPVYLDQPGPDGWYLKSSPNGGTYTWEIDPTQGADGTSRSLMMTVTEGVPYWWYKTEDQDAYINRNAEFPVNRMRFYIKFPQGWRRTDPLPYNYNFDIGTFHRDPNIFGNEETNNWHFYQTLVFDTYDNEWIKVDLNQWAQHQRSFKILPGVNPTKPIANFYQHLSRIYFAGEPYLLQPQVDYPYNVWFDEWEFYYQNEYVATQPEYCDRPITQGGVVYHPITITNTHLTENRRFGLSQSTELFGGDYWDYNVQIIRDDNGDGIHQDTENTVINETTLLAPHEKFYVFIRVETPAPDTYVLDTSYWWTSFVVYQKEPVWPGDPHLAAGQWGTSPGTPAAGTQIITRAVSVLPPDDTIPPAPIKDLIVQEAYDHSVKLAWTAPGDDGATGIVYAYDVRYSTSPITEGNFEDALPFTDELAPKASGAQEVYVVSPLLEPETFYYFALKAYDETYQATTISNVATAITLKAEEKKDIKVYAGSGQTITLPAIANLSGTVTKDGFPDPSIPTTWSKMSGPGTVTFEDVSAWATTASFSEAGLYTLKLTADDRGYIVSGSVPILVLSQGDTSALLLVDFGKTAQENKFELAGWSTAMIDGYTGYTLVGPGGTVGGTNNDYNYQGVQGTSYSFLTGDKIIITWYNNSANPITFNPTISFNDPDRRISGQTGTWYSIGQTTIPAYAIATTEFKFDSKTAGDYAVVNVNNNFGDGKQILVCDKIELVKDSGAEKTPLAPIVTSSTHPNQDKWISNNDPVFTWSNPQEVGITGYSYILDQVETTVPDDTSEGLITEASYTDKEDGIWYFHVKAQNNVGWGEVANYKIMIDTTIPQTPLLVDLGASAAANTFGLPGWETVIMDAYTHYNDIGPGGALGGSNNDYNYQGVTGTPRAFIVGEKIVVTWYNNSNNTITFTPKISFNDPDRRVSGAVGTWFDMSKVTIPAFATGKSEFEVNATAAGTYSLVNVNSNFANSLCDRIELLSESLGQLPNAPIVTSITHPNQDKAVSNNDPVFTWSNPQDKGITGYSYILDGVATTVPDDTSEGLVTQASYTDKADGIWYFHVKAQNSVGWGATAHYKIKINTTTPTPLLVDFGASAATNTFGLPGWGTVIMDIYTHYSDIGPGGALGGSNNDYNYQGVTGTPRAFIVGEKIVVTWYNNSNNTITFTPKISFNDPDRRVSGAVGTWFDMSKVTIPAFSTGKSEFEVKATAAGTYSLVNVNSNFASSLCDRIELLSFGPPPNAPIVTSSAHLNQDKWVTVLTWSNPQDTGIMGYSYILDQVATTIPDDTSEGLVTEASYTNKEDEDPYTDKEGDPWYFHVKSQNSAGWGATAHFPLLGQPGKPTWMSGK